MSLTGIRTFVYKILVLTYKRIDAEQYTNHFPGNLLKLEKSCPFHQSICFCVPTQHLIYLIHHWMSFYLKFENIISV